jgi:hypothetical protein
VNLFFAVAKFFAVQNVAEYWRSYPLILPDGSEICRIELRYLQQENILLAWMALSLSFVLGGQDCF